MPSIRGQAEGDDHRVGLGAEDGVGEVLDREQGDRGGQAGGVGGVAALARGGDQGKGHAPREHDTAERDGERGGHPQVDRVATDQGIGEREQIGQRLPGRGAVGVELSVPGEMAPYEPAVGVITGANPGPQNDQRGDDQEGQGSERPAPAIGQAAHPSPTARAGSRSRADRFATFRTHEAFARTRQGRNYQRCRAGRSPSAAGVRGSRILGHPALRLGILVRLRPGPSATADQIDQRCGPPQALRVSRVQQGIGASP